MADGGAATHNFEGVRDKSLTQVPTKLGWLTAECTCAWCQVSREKKGEDSEEGQDGGGDGAVGRRIRSGSAAGGGGGDMAVNAESKCASTVPAAAGVPSASGSSYNCRHQSSS